MDRTSILRPIEDNHKIIVFLFFIIYLFIGIFIFDNYGISWDEWAHRYNGLININYIIGKDPTLLTLSSLPNIRYNGPVFQILLVSIERILNLNDSRDIYLMRHLVTFLLFYTSVFFFYLLCKDRFHSWKIGLLGSLFLILSPRIFASSFYNPMDLPFLSMFIISIYTLVKYLDKQTLYRASLHALSCAISIDIRIMGILVPCFTLFFVTVDLILGSETTKIKNKDIILSLSLYGFLLISFTILFWPILWDNPIYHFILAFLKMSRIPSDISVLYLGDFIKAMSIPWHYIPVWLIITTPILYSFNFFVGLIASIKSTLKSPLNFYSNNQKRNDLIFLLWFFLPLLAVIVLKSVLYDSWRPIFFIYPAFLIISLKGLRSLFEFIKLKFKGQVYKIANIILILIILFSLIHTTQFMVKNHPYNNVYFNFLAGKNIAKNFDMDYWGLSFRQALEYILANDTDSTIKVNVSYPRDPEKKVHRIFNKKDRERLRYVALEEATYFLSNYRFPKEYYRFHKKEYPYNKNEIFSIKVADTKIMGVYKLK